MAKQLNVQMNVNANTQSAQAALKQLQQTLSQAISDAAKASGSMKITKEITEATQAATKLKVALDAALNPQTGNLDLSKFSQQLTKSKMTLQQYSQQLMNLGPTGEKAFMQMANAIVTAEVPMRRSNALLTSLWTTMKNTARWQLSSSALHAFMGAIQGAYGYAQDLNKSLNNIRIVTGQTTEQMAQFAEEANKAAKALSTTTTAYTDAALIYYQQGLTGKAVTERTEATIKLANVSRQSAEEVSSQMTAIWNNFADGSKNLEYYADVITALGAATASSSDEIAQGLQKFAAVADTVGLSYEKATAALATVVAETRQSADVVGTAFKTMFARFQGLSLGETLEDGVDLNKYSKALLTIGVNILDANGQLKQMDDILDETYQRWNQISEAQRVALAETVAGTRQYAQFMAIMNNYDKILTNQNLAAGSEGTLQEQADIYAESWEAASKRVQAAAQGIYQDLLDDKFFIQFNNSLAGLLEGIDKFIGKIGGIPGVLGLIGTIITSVFNDQLTAGLSQAIYNLKVFTGIAETEANEIRQATIKAVEGFSAGADSPLSVQFETETMKDAISLANELQQKKEHLTAEDAAELEQLIKITQQYGEMAKAAKEAVEAAQQTLDDQRTQNRQKVMSGLADSGVEGADLTQQTQEYDQLVEMFESETEAGLRAADAISTLNQELSQGRISTTGYDKIQKTLTTLAGTSKGLTAEQKQLQKALSANETVSNKLAAAEQRLKTAKAQLLKIQTSSKKDAKAEADAQKEVAEATQEVITCQNDLKTSNTQVRAALAATSGQFKNAQQVIDEQATTYGTLSQDLNTTTADFFKMAQAIYQIIQSENAASQEEERYRAQLEATQEAINNASVGGAIDTFSQGIVSAFRGVSQLSMGISTLKGVFDTLNNTEMSFGEKVLSIATSLGMAIPMLITGFQSLRTATKMFNTDLKESVTNLGLKLAGITAEKKAEMEEAGVTVAAAIADRLKAKANEEETATVWMKVAAYIAQKIAMSEVYIVVLLLIAAIAILVGAAIGLIAIFNAIKNASPEGKLQNAKEATEAAAKAADAAKEAYDNLLSTINKYQDAKDKIANLTKGTDEFREAVEEANDAARELMSTYGLTSFSVDENGLIKLDNKELDAKKAEYRGKVETTQSALVGAQNYQREKEDVITRRDMVSKAKLSSTMWNDGGNYNSLISSGNIEKVFTAARNAAGGTDSYFADRETAKSNIAATMEWDLDALTYAQQDFINAITSSEDSLLEFTNALDASAAASEAATKAQLASNLSDDEKFLNAKNQNAVLAAQMQKSSGISADKLSEVKNMSKDQLYREYAEAMGYASHGGGAWLDGKEEFYDENGEQVAKLTKEAVQEQYAEILAQRAMEEDALNTTIDSLNKILGQVGEDENLVSAALTKDTSNLKMGQIANMTAEDIQSMVGGLDEQDIKNLGYDNAQAMIDAMDQALQKAQGEWQSTLSGYTDKVATQMSNIASKSGTVFEDLSKGTITAWGNTLEKIYTSGGSEAIENINAGLTTIMEKNSSKAEEIMQAASGIDWNQEDAVEQLNVQLRDMGIYIDKNSAEWKQLTSGFSNVKIGFKPTDVATMRTQLTELQKLAKDIKIGSIISDEDFKKILELKPELRDLFVTTADGMAYIGNQDLSKTVEDMKLADLQKEMDKNAAAKAAIEASGRWGSDRGSGWAHHQDEWTRNVNDDTWLVGSGTIKDDGSIDKGTVGNLLGDTAALTQFAEATGRSAESVIADFTALTTATEDFKQTQDYADTKARVQAFFNDLGQLEADVTNGLYDNKNALELFATSFDDYDKMIEAINKLDISDKEKKELIDTAGIVVAQNEVQKLQGYLDDLVDKKYTIGMEIDSAKLQEFAALGIDTEDFFTDLGNGTALMFGDPNELEAKLQDAYLAPLQHTVNSLQEQRERFVANMTATADFALNIGDVSTYIYAEEQLVLAKQGELAIDQQIAEYQEKLDYARYTRDAEKYGLSLETLEAQARGIVEVEGVSLAQARRMAVANERLNKGVAALVKNWTDQRKVLVKLDKTSQDYAETLNEVKQETADLVGAYSKDMIPDDFYEMPGVLKLMDKAAEGDTTAINELGVALTKAQNAAMELGDPFENMSDEQIQSWKSRMSAAFGSVFDGGAEAWANEFTRCQGVLDEFLSGYQTAVSQGADAAQAYLDTSGDGWITALNEMAAMTGMSVDEMNSKLNQLGIQAEVTSEVKKVTQKVPKYNTKTSIVEPGDPETGDGRVVATSTWQDGYDIVDGEMEVAQINAGNNLGGTLGNKPTFVGHSAPSDTAKSGGSKGGGGGGSKQQSAKEHKQPKDEKERYHVLNEQLEDLSREYDKASKAKDRLFGANRLKAIDSEIKALDKLIKHNQSYLKAIEVYRKQDKDALLNGGLTKDWVDSAGNLKTFTSSGLGIGLQFDADGNLLNYDQYIETAVNAYNAAVDTYNQVVRAEGVTEEQVKLAEDIFKQAEMQYELAMEALSTYEESNNKYQDKLEEIRDSLREQQDKRLEEFQYKLELKIKISDNNLKYLEYLRKSIADDKWASVEYLETLWNKAGTQSDWTERLARGNDLHSAWDELKNKTHGDVVLDANGNIVSQPELSQEGYIEETQDLIDSLYEEIDALWELDDTMCHYYEETLQKGEEELDKYMARLEDVTSVLEHYKTISELLGKEKDYQWMGEILSGQSNAKFNEMDSARKQFEAAAAQYEHMQQNFEALKAAGVDEATLQKAEAELDAQYDVMVKWQESYLSKTEEYAELQKAIYENMVESIAKTMEDAFTGGMGFDRMLESMEMVSSTQDMILTKTNQIYETNKLMRKLSQDIDKTDSVAAKTKLANFRQEIADMQEKNEMSKFDLEVANARYELLLAEIALEDAQNAKSTVRLQRDSEGNYGYVYTADQDKIADAEQNVADKKNDLYNLSLNKANENAQALVELNQELTDKLKEISLDYSLTEEERQKKMAAVQEEYAQKRARLEQDYLEANFWLNETAAESIYEAWANNYTDIGSRLGEYYLDKTGKEGEIKLVSSGVAQAFSDDWKASLGTATTDALSWKTNVNTYISDVQTAFRDYQTEMDTNVRPVVGQSLDELKSKVSDLDKTSDSYKQHFDNFVTTNSERLRAISDITHQYFLQRQELLALIAAHQAYIREMQAQIEEAANSPGDTVEPPETPTETPTEETQPEPTNTGDNNGSGGSGSLVEFLTDVFYGRSGNGEARKQYFRNLGYSDAQIAEYQGVINAYYSQNGGDPNKAWAALRQAYGFDTGGYTGEWGSGGKLAFLHEKEIVLNSEDTKNLLDAVNLIREISSAIDLRAASSSLAAGLNSPSYQGLNQMLEQTVTIHAEFPNATQHNEIEEAFNNLINRAAQYANRAQNYDRNS